MVEDDIKLSLYRALTRDGWLYGERLQRIGNPFIWIDGDRTPHLYVVHGPQAFLQYLTMFYEYYPTPNDIITPDYNMMRQHIERVLRKAYNYFVPFADIKDSGFENNLVCSALVRTQDYCLIRKFCKGMHKNLKHLDIGPGLGTHLLYSLKGFESCFYALEASPHSYAVQRDFFRFLSSGEGTYLDLIECENFNLSFPEISSLVNKENRFRIKHIPSWYFAVIADNAIDLVTATWVLNEVNEAGILWLLSNVSRVLHKGGYLYIRDSARLKPMRHSIDYDKLLSKLKFAEVGRLKVKNRVDFFGVPRAYQKKSDRSYSFEELVDMCLGRFAVTAHGGAYIQNAKPVRKKD